MPRFEHDFLERGLFFLELFLEVIFWIIFGCDLLELIFDVIWFLKDRDS
jgi:hypothetical protein